MKINFILLFLFTALMGCSSKVTAPKSTEASLHLKQNRGDFESATPEIVSEMDPLGNKEIVPPQKNQKATQYGTLIESSCYQRKGRHAGTYESKVLKRFHDALGFALGGLVGCRSRFGFEETRQILSALRRTTIRCAVPSESSSLAYMSMDHGSQKAKGSASQKGLLFHMTLFRFGNQKSTSVDETVGGQVSPEFLAATIAHEAMHAVGMDNTEWHNNPVDRGKFGCHDSMFEDRIFFMEAVCFPKGMLGQNLFLKGGSYSCPEVCLSALASHSDQSLTPPPGGLLARTYSRSEAEPYCKKIQEWGDRFINGQKSDL